MYFLKFNKSNKANIANKKMKSKLVLPFFCGMLINVHDFFLEILKSKSKMVSYKELCLITFM